MEYKPITSLEGYKGGATGLLSGILITEDLCLQRKPYRSHYQLWLPGSRFLHGGKHRRMLLGVPLQFLNFPYDKMAVLRAQIPPVSIRKCKGRLNFLTSFYNSLVDL